MGPNKTRRASANSSWSGAVWERYPSSSKPQTQYERRRPCNLRIELRAGKELKKKAENEALLHLSSAPDSKGKFREQKATEKAANPPQTSSFSHFDLHQYVRKACSCWEKRDFTDWSDDLVHWWEDITFLLQKKNNNKQYNLLTMQHSRGKSFLFICCDERWCFLIQCNLQKCWNLHQQLMKSCPTTKLTHRHEESERRGQMKGKTGGEELSLWQNWFYFTHRIWKQGWKSNGSDSEILINPQGNKYGLIAFSHWCLESKFYCCI